MGRRRRPGKCRRRRRLRGHRARDVARCVASGKVCFPDTASAQRALDEAQVAREFIAGWFGSPTWSNRQERRMYHCGDCHQWHLTSTP
ncbi:hypothetical protein [Flexivirga lutea]